MNKRSFIAILGILLLVNLATISTVQASAPNLSASSNYMDYTENAISSVDPGMIITGSTNITSAKVFIGDGYISGEDRLVYTTTNGITGSFSSTTAILTLTGNRSTSDYQDALRNVKYENTMDTPNTAVRNVTFVLGGNAVYNPDTGHYYEAVDNGANIAWTAANTAAQSRDLYGLQGYLVTITSSNENSFIGSKASADAWIGASDASVEGDWRWVTGPEGTENAGAGRQFYSGLGGAGGFAVGGEYNNWASGEPNDAGGEDHAHMYGSHAQKDWNDYPDSLNVRYYMVEYGGMAGDPALNLSATITVNVTAVNDAPTTPGAFTTPTSGQIINGSSTVNTGWGGSTDLEGDAVKYDLWFFNGTWVQIGNLLGTNSMSYALPEDDTENAMFRVYANDTMDNSSVRDVTFTIDSSAPAYSWIQKILNASTGETVTVEINLTDVAGVDWCNITVDEQEYQMNNNSGNYSWNISIPASDSGTLVSSMTYNCSFADVMGHANNTESILMNVSILPIANFTADVTRGISPLTVNFTDNSSGLVENWNWNFGDGNNSTNQNATHAFNSGNYTVALNVSNGNGTSISYINVRCAYEPTYTKSPENESTSTYGEEINFTIESSLFSSYRWFIDGNPINGSGITLYNNTDDSSKLSYCLINSSQYINQSDFFMDIYNVSVQASNESIGRTDTHSWEWTVTNSSADAGDEVEVMINTTPVIVTVGGDSYLRFNTTNNNELDSNGLACSITGSSFNTTNSTSGIQIKVEVLNVSSINTSSINFSTSSIYQYLDIDFNNETLANAGSNNRSIEFRVLNQKSGGTLILNTVYLRHWDSTQWEAYTPEFTANDDTYSYFVVRNISGFSPFAVTCGYQYSSASTSRSDGMSVYLKQLLFWNNEDTLEETVEEAVEPELIDTGDTDSTEVSDSSLITEDTKTAVATDEEVVEDKESSKFQIFGILALLIIAGFFIIFMKKKKDEEGKQL